MSELSGAKLGEYYIVKETTFVGRAQVKLGLPHSVFEVPSPVCGNLYEPAPVALGKGESIIVYDATGKIVMQS